MRQWPAPLEQSAATLYGASFTTVNESVNIQSVGASAGLLARWNSATQTGYQVVWDGSMVQLFSVVNGMATRIGMHALSGTTGTLQLVVNGTNLEVLFDNSLLIGPLTDTTITGPGTAGLFSLGGSSFKSYSFTGS